MNIDYLSEKATVLRSHSGELRKTIRADGTIIGFSAGKHFSVDEVSFHDFDGMRRTVDETGRDPRTAIIRGQSLPGINRQYTQRLSNGQLDGRRPTFGPCPRQWIGLDIDSLEEPPCADFRFDTEECIEHARSKLPPPFRDVSCYWQATGSAGVKPGIRARLWFWLSRPVSDAEAKGWLQDAPVDKSLFTPVALHYTAPPRIAPGAIDPMNGRRSGVIEGDTDTVEVPDVLPTIERVEAAPIEFAGEPDLEAFKTAFRRAPVARQIWKGERTYPDRSTKHFAFAVSLVRAGLRDLATLAAAIVALGEQHREDPSKIGRNDYLCRTIAAALAAAGV